MGEGEQVVDTTQSIIHLSQRASFGEHVATISQWASHGYEATVKQLLTTGGQDLRANISAPGQETRQHLGQDFTAVREAWIAQMLSTTTPLLEKMTLFWHNHFATAEYKVQSAALMLSQNNTLRKNALGSFRQMLLDITQDPAMLIWLDNARSTKRAPNENYGRELMELFTIGLTYTQSDVTAASEAMTGYALNRKTGDVTFVDRRHSHAIKTFFGDTGDLGPTNIIDDLLANPKCAPFVVTKILKWFVHPMPPSAWVTKFAGIFQSSGYDIAHLMQSIFLSDEFVSQTAVANLFKTPVDYAIGLARRSQIPVPIKQLDQTLTLEGMQLMNPPNVAGWIGGPSWLNSATMSTRFNFAYALARRLPPDAPTTVADVLSHYQVYNPSSNTMKVMTDYAQHSPANAMTLAQQLHYLLWISPEFQMC